MAGFIMVCKLYIRMRIKEEIVEEQIQWILMYVQKVLTNVWKKNILIDLKSEDWEFLLVEDLLVTLKRELEGEDNKLTKITKLKQVE